MNVRSSSGYYGRSNYRKRKWRNILIISAISLVILIVVFLVVGNILKKKTQDDDNAGAGGTSVSDNTVIPEPVPHSINGYFVDMSGLSYAQFSDWISTLSANGVTAVSLNLTDDTGILLYDSKTAQKLGYQTASDSRISLSSIVTKAESRGIYTGAYITLNSFGESDAKVRSAKLAYEAAIVCEIAEAGIDDVIVRCPGISAEYIDELVRFAESIKNINSDAQVGIALTRELLEMPDASLYVEKLVTAFNFTALDLTGNGDSEVSAYVEESLSGPNVRYYILRYNTRILLPYTEDEEARGQLEALLASNSINNWQIVKK